MPSIQMSLLTAVPWGLGQMLPDLRSEGVRRYIATRAPEKPVCEAPAIPAGTNGVSSTRAGGDLGRGQRAQELGRLDRRHDRERVRGHGMDAGGLLRAAAPFVHPRMQDVRT